MKLLEEIISTLDASRTAEEVLIGPFDTAVKSLRWGLSSTFRDPCSGKTPACIREGSSFRQIRGLKLVTIFKQESAR